VVNDTNHKFKHGKQQQAFNNLKEILTSSPILTYPDYGKPFTLHTDARMNGLGAVLYEEVDRLDRVISYTAEDASKQKETTQCIN